MDRSDRIRDRVLIQSGRLRATIVPQVAPVLDLARVRGLAEMRAPDGSPLIARIVDLYAASAPAQVARIREAVAHGDPVELGEAAHRLKGEGASVGASVVVALARDLEALGDAGRVGGTAAQLDCLERAVDTSIAALRRYLDGGPDGADDAPPVS